jgi:RND superfamily putative drug exporter
MQSSKLYRFGHWLVRHRKPVVIIAIIATLLSLVAGGMAMERLSLARFQATGSESVEAATVLDEEFDTGVPNLTVVVEAKQGTVDDAAVAEAGRKLAEQLATEPAVTEVMSYWTSNHSPVLRGESDQHALIIARVAGNATEARAAIADISPKFTRDDDLMQSMVGGRDEVFRQVGAQAREDFLRAEMIIIPLMIILLYVVYRRISAALLTLGVGLFAVFSTLTILGVLALFTEISTFASNLTLVMGLGLGLDYSLLMIARLREELRRGSSLPEAIATSVARAGRTVLFSGLTVAVSLLGLLLLPFPFLQSFAYAGIAVVLMSLIGAVVILPAALAMIGTRIMRRSQPTARQEAKGVWARTAHVIMRRPMIYGGLALAVILVLASPTMRLNFGLPDDRILPVTASSRQAQQQIRDHFTAEQADAVQIVSAPIDNPTQHQDKIADYAQRLSLVSGIAQVDSLTGTYRHGQLYAEAADTGAYASTDRTWLSAVPESDRLERDAAGLVRDVRALPAPFPVLVGGAPAEVTDFRDALLNRLPLVFAFILVVTFVLLMLMTGSLLLPLIATVLNLLSLSVMFGAIIWVFQEGNLSGLLNFTPTGFIEPSIPILMLCVAYGLSMDYQVFVLARIREAYNASGDNTKAVINGLQHSAPIVISAAVILAVTFLIYVTSGVTQLKMLAIGMAVAVFIDATIIRLVLLPACMRLGGRANWWLPGPLRRLYERVGLHD